MMRMRAVLFVSLCLVCVSSWAVPPPWTVAAEKARAPEVYVGKVLDVTSPPQAPGRHRIARVEVSRVARSASNTRPGQVIKIHFEVTPPRSLGPKPIRLVESERYALFLRVTRKGPKGRDFGLVGNGDGAIPLSKDNRVALDKLSQLIGETRRMPHLGPREKDELCGLYEKLRSSIKPVPPVRRGSPPPARPKRRRWR